MDHPDTMTAEEYLAPWFHLPTENDKSLDLLKRNVGWLDSEIRGVQCVVCIFVLSCTLEWALDIPPNSLLLGVLNSFSRCVRPLCHCWGPPFFPWQCSISIHCLPGLSLLVSALFRWPCSISIHLSPRSVAAGVRPFALAM